jgi:hypothetical protein
VGALKLRTQFGGHRLTVVGPAGPCRGALLFWAGQTNGRAQCCGLGLTPGGPGVSCRGGLIFWADLVGAKRIADRLNEWADYFAPAGISGFFKPCEYLQRAAASGTRLSAGVQGASKL